MRLTLLLPILVATPLLADEANTPADPHSKARDCYCTDRDHNRVELGQTICLQVDGRMFTARCEMSLNNPMWREVDDGCATSIMTPRRPAGPFG